MLLLFLFLYRKKSDVIYFVFPYSPVCFGKKSCIFCACCFSFFCAQFVFPVLFVPISNSTKKQQQQKKRMPRKKKELQVCSSLSNKTVFLSVFLARFASLFFLFSVLPGCSKVFINRIARQSPPPPRTFSPPPEDLLYIKNIFSFQIYTPLTHKQTTN